MSQELIIVIALALVFDFLNGMRDSSNIVATMISSRAFSPRRALTIAAVAEFLGPFLFGIVVAKTIGDDIVQSNVLTLNVIAAALIGAIIWNLITWYFGIPGSSSHALIGGMVGAVLTGSGIEAIKFGGLNKVLIALFAFPLIGFAFGFLMTRFIYFLARGATPRVNELFKHGQWFTAIAMAFGQGTNDAQKTMGIIAILLFSAGYLGTEFYVPFIVVITCYFVIALGTFFGGWRIVRTMGMKITKLKPMSGFCAETSSALTLFLANFLGIPVSTTHTITGSIVGVGSIHGYRAVRWGIARRIVWAWILTIPAVACVSALIWLILNALK